MIALVIAVYGVAASPLPKTMKRSQFDAPIAVEELDRWVGLLGGVGIVLTRDELAEHTYQVGKVFADLRGVLLGPFKPWFRISGTGQGWGLFTYPDSFPHQLVVEVREAGEWRVVYAALDPERDWMRPALAYRRVRGVYDGNTRKPGASYWNFVDFVAARALADHPAASEARVGFMRTHSVRPGEEPDPERSPRFQKVVAR